MSSCRLECECHEKRAKHQCYSQEEKTLMFTISHEFHIVKKIHMYKTMPF